MSKNLGTWACLPHREIAANELVGSLPAGKNEVDAENRAEADEVDVAAEVELVQLDESDPLLLLTLPAREGGHKTKCIFIAVGNFLCA